MVSSPSAFSFLTTTTVVVYKRKMIRKEKFVPGYYYHIYNRTLFNIPEFRVKKNAVRLQQSFLLANSTNSTPAFTCLRSSALSSFEKAAEIAAQGEKLVDVLCYVIMPDHYHLLIREKREGGISSFIHKCNISVAKYINIKNDRRGPLFESLFQSKNISTNEYLFHLSLYIHLNPLDFISGRGWRNHELKNWNSIKNQLLSYPWSSLKFFLDDDHKDPIISGAELIKNEFDKKNTHGRFLKDWFEDSLNMTGDLKID